MTDRTLLKTRADRLAAAVRDADLDCAALVPGASFYYLTGIQLHLMERPTVLFVGADGALRAVIPVLEKSRWQADMPDVDTEYWQDSDGFDGAFSAIAARMSARRIGVEGQRMRVFESDALRRHFGADSVVDAQAHIAAIRLHKDPTEIALQQRAIAISETALQKTVEQVRAGMSEREIQQMLQIEMLQAGGEGFGFEPIVLAGAMSADPHGVPSHERQLGAGDALLIDFGALHGGYSADLTRTFFCQQVSQEHRDIYETVRAANAKGHEVAAPGVTAHDLDAAVTKVLRDSPFADLILHKTGHGLGLDVHEAPQIMAGNKTRLAPGMVFTVEPGLYRIGDIGVRIEDDVVTTEEGCRSLSGFERGLTIIGG